MRFRAGSSTTMPRSSGSMPRSRRHWIIGLPSCPPSRRRVSKGHCPRARFFKPSGRGGAFAPPPRSGMRTPSPTGACSSRDRQERRRCLSPHTPRTTMSGGSRFQVPTGRQILRSCFLPGRLRIRRSPLPSSRAGLSLPLAFRELLGPHSCCQQGSLPFPCRGGAALTTPSPMPPASG